MPMIDKKESKKWGKYRPNCFVCGQFVGIGGYFELDYGIDGYGGPTTVDLVLCKKHNNYKDDDISDIVEPGKPLASW
ncbi:MAG: hypothetical protein GY841_15740 [FCB group bacterium]|nr:hypothetical protein [FCB group bacterium]